jgi:hypothetical protein
LHSYKHKKLIEAITQLDEEPSDSQAFSDWIHAESHLAFLQENARDNELVIYASGEYTFVHSVVVSNARLSPIDQEDLMGWSLNPWMSIASYVTGGGRDDVWIECGLSGTGTKTLEDAMQLIFYRTFEGWTGSGGITANCIRNTRILLAFTGVPKNEPTAALMNMVILRQWSLLLPARISKAM